MASVRRLALAWALALLFGSGAYLLAGHAARALPAPTPLEELAYYPSGIALRPLTFGEEASAADLAWLRAVQYYGEHRKTDNRFVRLEHVFDILTTLSPDFRAAYVFGAFSLAQEGFDFPAAVRLLAKGVEQNPTDGELAFEMGFLHFVRPGGRELALAGEWFERAARLPGAPASAVRFAAYARQNSGELAVSRLLWSDVRERSSNPLLRDIAAREIARIDSAIARGDKTLAVRHLGSPSVVLQHR